MNWISFIGLLLFLVGTIFTFVGNFKSTSKSTKKIDSLYQNIIAKNEEIALLKNWNNKISIRLLEQVHSKIESLFRTIFLCSTVKYSEGDNLTESVMLRICENCQLESKTGSMKVVSSSPFKLDDMTVREDLLNNWFFISKYLDEINFASTYIQPQAYELALRIKKSNLAMTVDILSRPNSGLNLKSWGKEFYGLFILNKELSSLIVTLNNEKSNVALQK